MQVLRTPESCFENLPDFPFAPHYQELLAEDGTRLRMHYLDEGNAQGQVILLMHGEPSWCFLYRKMIPILAKRGFRVLAPDLIGFGRSDKPAEQKDYSYQSHVHWVLQWMDALDLNDVVLFGQDWGGLIGLRLAAENEHRFSHIIAANTTLPTGDQRPSEVFFSGKNFLKKCPNYRWVKLFN